MRKTTFNQTNVLRTLCSLSLLLFIATQTIAQNTSYLYFSQFGQQRVELGDVFDGFSNATFEAWVYIRDDGGNTANTRTHEITSKHVVSSFALIDDSQTGIDGQHRLFLSIGDGTSWPTSGFSSVATIPENTWTHVAASWQGSDGEVKLYINGQLDSTGTILIPGNVAGNNVASRAIADYGGGFWNDYRLDGYIDELRIWDDVRTPTEILTNYLKTVLNNSPNLVARYDFDENGGGTLNDRTGNGFNGTLTNLTLSDPTPGDGSNGNWYSFLPMAPIDDTAPVINLSGDATVNIEIGSTYNDSGATANDNIDGDITGNINTVNSVNTAVAGSYSVTYNVSDAAGNAATQVTRTVNVLDVSLSGTPTNASCSNASDGSVNLTPSGGTAPYENGLITYEDSFSGALNSGNYSNSGFTATTTGTELQLQPTSGSWGDHSFVTNQTFTREAGLTFEGSVFIPWNNYKAVMVGFNDGTANGTSSVSHGLYFFDNGTTSPVGITARIGSDGGAAFSPAVSYTNNASPGIWMDFKIVLKAGSGATYYVKKSTDSSYSDSYDTNLGSVTSLKVGVQATTSGTTNYSRHKNWRVYRTQGITSNLGVGTYNYFTRDANGFEETASATISNGDMTDPGVTITNGSPTTHEAYTTYTDAGATATDNCSSGATITNTVNNVPANPAPGNYTVVYTATDSAGNTSTGARTVNVTDTTAPSLSSISMVSNNSNTSQADLNDEITLSFTASEVINTPTVVIAGETATVSHQGGNVWNATITVDSNTTEGDASLTISNITDGTNSASNVTTLSNGNNPVDIDRTSPSAPSVSPDLKASSDTGREDDDNLTKDNTPTFTISGFTAEPGDVVKIYDGGTSGTLLGTSTTLTGGETSVDITSSTLSDGNSFSITATITDNFNRESAESSAFTALVIDTEAPTAAFVSVGLNVGSYPVNNTMREVNAQDKGFQLAIQFSETMDHWNANFPTLTYTPDGSTPVGSQDPTTGFTTGNGIPNSLFYFRSDPVDNNTEFDDIDIQVSGSTDYAGNVMTTVTFSDAFSIDMIGPSGDENTVLASSQSVKGGATITLDANVPAGETAWLVPTGSTINQLFSFTTNGSTITSSTAGGNTLTAPTTSGTYQLYVLDDVHNFSSPATATITVDDTAPTISEVALVSDLDEGETALGTASANETVTWAVTGTGVSIGANNGVVTLDSGAVVGNTYQYTITATDAAGNSSTTNTITVTVNDITKPVITLIGDNPQTIELGNSYTELNATATDNLDGNISNNIQINTSNLSINAVGSYTVTYNVDDAAGNSAVEVTRTVNVVDTTAPTLTTQNVTVSLDASGNASITEQDVVVSKSDASGVVLISLSKSDFTCSDLGSNTVTVTAKDGGFGPTGNYIDSTTFSTPGSSRGAVADIDNDGDIDVLAGPIFFKNNGNGTFTSQSIANLVSQGSFGDLDNDGDLDIISPEGVFTYNGASYSQTQTFTPNGSTTDRGVVVDLNGDNYLDYFVPTYYQADDRVYIKNTTTGLFEATDYSTASYRITATAGDFNKDGHNDVISAGSGSGSVDIMLGTNDGSGNLTFSPIQSHTAYINRIIAADINGDTNLDLIWSHASLHMSYILGNGDGTFQSPVTVSGSLNYTAGSRSIFAFDYEGDGDIDILEAKEANDMVIWINNGSAQFTEQILTGYQGGYHLNGANLYSDALAADFNGDGLKDFFLVRNGTSKVVLSEQGVGNTTTQDVTITVEDNEDPVITVTNGNVTHEAYTTYTDAGATVTDNCSASITSTVNNVPTDVAQLHPGTYTVVYTATDSGNNVVTATRNVTVVDTTDPVAVAQDITIQLDASGNASITTAQINNGSTDNSNGNLTYAVSPNTFDCANVGQDCGANSLNFDGTTYAGNANGPNITNISDSGFTLEAWVKPTSLGGVNSVIRKDGDYNLYFNGGVLTADVWNGSNFLTRVINTGPSPSLNTWSHIAFVWNGSAGLFYINGTQYAGNLAPFGTQAAANNPFEIGQSTTFVQNFVGNIDDVRLWSTQRTSTEINDNYAKCLSGSETGLQIYFKTLAGSGSVLRDFSPNGYDATIYGANWSVDAPPLIGVSNVVTLTVTDPSGNTDTATATVTVEDNINPTITLNGDANMTVIMPGTFTDPGATPADNCYATVQVSGTVDTNTPGTYVLTYTAVDSSRNQSNSVTRSVFVNGLPTASDDTVTVDEDDVEYVINVMDNDSYGPDGAGFISITTASTNGTAVVDGNTIKYTPTARATSDSLIYTVEDSNGDTVSATVNITINRLPSGTDSTFTVEEDSTNNDINTIANNDFDLDGPGSITLISGTTSQGGTVSINQNGTANDVTDDTFTYTPVVQFVGTDTFEYTVTDGNGDTSSAITVTIDVVAVVPVAANDNPTIKEDYTNQVLNILANDTFRDTTTDDLVSFTISGATASQGGAISIDTNGTTDPADDTVIYTPVTQFVGQETFTYTLTDANGDSDTGTVTIDVVPVIPQPKDDNFTVNQDTENHVFNLFADNGNGADGYETTSPDTLISFTISGTNTTANGTLTLNDQGTPEPWDDTVTYSPRATYNGNDSFTYTLVDENGDSASATVNIVVRPIVPVPVDDTATVTKNSSNNTINVLDNDDFGGNGPNTTHPLTFTNGSLSSASEQGGTIIISPNGTPGDLTDDVILYTPRADFTGVDTFRYVLTDFDGDANSALVTITVNAGGGGMTTPTALDDAVTVNADSSDNVVNVLSNDQPGLDGYINNGLTMLNGTSSGSTAQGGTVTVDNKNTNDTTDDVINYTPAAGYTGTDTFQYTITDASGDAATATVNITVNAVTNVPNAVDDTVDINQNSTNNNIAVLANDSEGTDGLASITLSGNSTTAGGTIAVNPNGAGASDDSVTYTPPSNYVGQDSFTYTIEDTNGDTSTATVVITVLPVVATNGTPSAVDDTASATQGGGTITIDVLDNDNYGTDGPNATHQLTFTNGSVTNASANGAHLEVVNNKIEYTPTGSFSGTDTFTYVITDASGDADRADVVVTITAGAGGLATPTANDDATTAIADSGVKVIDVLANDTPGIDGYADGGLTMTNGTLNSASANGGAISVDQKGTPDTTDDVFNYMPPAGFTGTDTFQYTITDDSGDADTATVTVVVSAITDVPNAVDDAETVTTDVATSIDVLDNDSYGTDGAAAVDPLTVSGTTTEGGTTSVVANEVVYTSPSGFSGVDTFTYTIEDANGDTDTATVTVTVSATPVNNGTPTANDDTATATQGGSTETINVLVNDDYGSDGPNATHQLTFKNGATVNASTNGAQIAVVNNQIEYTPTASFSGTDTFEYIITDGSGDADRATVTVTVSSSGSGGGGGGGTATDPVATNDTTTVDKDSSTNVIDVLANDQIGSAGFIAGHGLRLQGGLSERYTNEGGFLRVNENGTPNDASDDTIEYTPAPGFNGADSFSYTITNGNGISATATVSITVQVPRTSSTEGQSFNNSFTVYPNPSKGYVKTTVESATSGKATVYLVDTVGKIIYKSEVNLIEGNNNLEFDFRVSTGVMYLKIIGSTNYGTKKIIFE